MMRTALLIVALLAGVAPAAEPATQSFSLPKPTRVTIKLDHLPVADALTKLITQAGFDPSDAITPALTRRLADMKVTADFVDTPYLLALLEVCRQASLEPRDSLRRPKFQVRVPPTTEEAAALRAAATRYAARSGAASRPAAARPPATSQASARAGTIASSWVEAPVIMSGPFAIMAEATAFTNVFVLDEPGARPGAKGTLRLEMGALADPALHVAGVAQSVVVEEAQDELGNSLLPTEGPGQDDLKPDLNGWSQIHWPARAELARPSLSSRRIAVFRGRLNVVLVTRNQGVDLVESGSPVAGNRTAGDLHYTVAIDHQRRDDIRLAVTIQRDGRDAREWEQLLRNFHQEFLRAQPAEGDPLHYTLQAWHKENPQKDAAVVTVAIHPSALARDQTAQMPSSLAWDMPTELRDFALPVEFKDLPLP